MTKPKPADPQAVTEPAAALLRLVMAIAESPDLAAYADAECLSAPESRVLQSLLAGHTPAALAAELGVTLNTVRRHTAALRRKTGYASVAELLMAIGRLPPMPWLGTEGK